MSCRVVIAPRALKDIEDVYKWIAKTQNAPLNATRWVNGIFGAISTLSKFPDRCTLAPESKFLAREVRQLIYYSHRIIFSIDGNTVEVFHIRHMARLPLTIRER